MTDYLRAGAAALDVSPPLGLPMIGFVRRQQPATGYGLRLEVSALVLEQGETRVVLCGVDTIGIPAPEVDRLRERAAEAAGADPAGVLLNWNHTHCAPPGSLALLERGGLLAAGPDERTAAYAAELHDRVVAVCKAAAARLEPAAVAWGTGEANLAVNRRERAPDGRIVHGWREDGLVDLQVVALQARRPDDSAICTLVAYGCHTVSVGMDVLSYSADYPGPLRNLVFQVTSSPCVFFQAAGANVLPRCSFGEDEREAERMGRRLGVEALHALADRPAWPRRLTARSDGSLIPMILFRYEELPPEPTPLAAAERRLSFPLLPPPSLDEVAGVRADLEAQVRAAEARGAGAAELWGLAYHAKWARRTEEDLRAGAAPAAVEGSVHAVRIGDGVIVTAPGEAFTEIGMAVKERSPGRPTLYAGYTNGAVGYFPTAAAYPEGGYEPAYSNRSYGLPAPLAPECERLLVEEGVRLAESLFPEREPYAGEAWTASGALPPYPPERIVRPCAIEYAPPPVAPEPD